VQSGYFLEEPELIWVCTCNTVVCRDSSIGIATRYGLVGPGIESSWGARIYVPVQTGLGAHPSSYTMDTGSFTGVKRPGRDVDHPPTYSAEVKERVHLYIRSLSGPSWPVVGRTWNAVQPTSPQSQLQFTVLCVWDLPFPSLNPICTTQLGLCTPVFLLHSRLFLNGSCSRTFHFLHTLTIFILYASNYKSPEEKNYSYN
jgi:hypothetical protein